MHDTLTPVQVSEKDVLQKKRFGFVAVGPLLLWSNQKAIMVTLTLV